MKSTNGDKSKKKIKLFQDIKSTLLICAEQFVIFLKSLRWWQILLMIMFTAVIVGIVCVTDFAKEKYEKIETEEVKDEDIIVKEEVEIALGTGYTNFVVFGSDSRSANVDKNLNTDTIIIVSLNNETKEIKMVSVYRDTLLDIGDRNIQKCNSAYSRGGAAQAMNMLNNNLDLNIKKYVTVNFGAVADVVDMLGGIEVDVSEAEMYAMNRYIKETANIIDGEGILITEPGVQTLDGVQAVTYSRIRKGVGDDFARSERQREVIQQIYKSVLKSDLSTINGIIDAVLPQISTNFTMSEIVAYASNFLNYTFGETAGFPFEKNTGRVGSRGSCVYATTLESNVKMLHDMLFEDLAYQPSDEVHKISIEVAYLVTASGKSPSTSDSDKKEEDKKEEDKKEDSKEENKKEEDKKEDIKDSQKEPDTSKENEKDQTENEPTDVQDGKENEKDEEQDPIKDEEENDNSNEPTKEPSDEEDGEQENTGTENKEEQKPEEVPDDAGKEEESETPEENKEPEQNENTEQPPEEKPVEEPDENNDTEVEEEPAEEPEENPAEGETTSEEPAA